MTSFRAFLGQAVLLPLVGCSAAEDYGSQVKVELLNESGQAIAQVKIIGLSGRRARELRGAWR